jgi:hypothetical protein
VDDILPVNGRFILTLALDRVLYTPERLEKIATEAAKNDLIFSPRDRIGLLKDVSELSNAGLTLVSSLLTLVDIWRGETNCKLPFHFFSIANLFALDLVWAGVLNSFEGILRAFEEHPRLITTFRAFIRVRFIFGVSGMYSRILSWQTLFVPLVQRLGYEFLDGESVNIVELRKTAITGAVIARDERCVPISSLRLANNSKTVLSGSFKIVSQIIWRPVIWQESLPISEKRFSQWYVYHTATTVIYRVVLPLQAARYGGREEFEVLLKIIENPVTPADRRAAMCVFIRAIRTLQGPDLQTALPLDIPKI